MKTIWVFSYFEFKIRIRQGLSFQKQQIPVFQHKTNWFSVRSYYTKEATVNHAWLILVEFT